MKKKVYWTYRHKWTNNWVRYTPSYFLDKQFADYLKAWLTATLDNEIPENRYTAEITPWIKKQTRFIIWEYEDTVINAVDFSNSIKNVWAEFAIQIFPTTTDAITWIKANTDLKLISETTDTNWVVITAKFEINPAWTDMNGQATPAKYLIID